MHTREEIHRRLELCRDKLMATHYLCERCGGSGDQGEGMYNPDTKTYNSPAGICQSCDGSGFLGRKPTRSEIESQT